MQLSATLTGLPELPLGLIVAQLVWQDVEVLRCTCKAIRHQIVRTRGSRLFASRPLVKRGNGQIVMLLDFSGWAKHIVQRWYHVKSGETVEHRFVIGKTADAIYLLERIFGVARTDPWFLDLDGLRAVVSVGGNLDEWQAHYWDAINNHINQWIEDNNTFQKCVISRMPVVRPVPYAKVVPHFFRSCKSCGWIKLTEPLTAIED